MSYDIIVGRNEQDKKSFGNRGLVLLGKGYVKMGQYTSLSNKIYMDIARSHVILVAGKRGSGKSYTLGVIAEELSNLPKETSQNIASLIFDTMGIYWTMKYQNEKDKELLKDWKLEPKNLPVKT
ncbi:MAG: ATP-binding protein, partial [Nanoarchaeota archaeon]|nr:ATP-binding protein [Nanoarchaeota archaeon]